MIDKLILILLFCRKTASWQLPGLIPKNYEKGAKLDIMVGQLESRGSAFTHDFYTLNWCPTKSGLAYDPDTFGTTLTGTPTHESPYRYKFGKDKNEILCTKYLQPGEAEMFSYLIENDFKYKLYLDGLPSATIMRDDHNREMEPDYSVGIPIGRYDGEGQVAIYNHLDIFVIVHNTPEGHHRIVGFEVEPYSMAEGSNSPEESPSDNFLRANQALTFSYRIISRVSILNCHLCGGFSLTLRSRGRCASIST